MFPPAPTEVLESIVVVFAWLGFSIAFNSFGTISASWGQTLSSHRPLNLM